MENDGSIAFRESEILFRALSRQAVFGFTKTETVSGKYVFVNQRFADIVGYAREELLAMDFHALTEPADLASDLANVDRLIRGELHEYSMEKRYRRKDGSRVWVNLTVFPLWGEGESPQYLVGLIEDISARKQMEDKLRRSEADLREAQTLTHAGSWRWDVTHDKLAWSDEMYRIYGIAPDAFAGSWYAVVGQAVHPDDVARVREANRAVLENRDAQPIEYRIVRPDGSIRTIWDQTGEITLDSDGHVLSLIGVALDITERRKAQDELQALNTQLEERVRRRTAELEAANRELEAFSYSVSHDLRAPLRSIDGFSQAFLEDFGAGIPEEGRHDLERVRKATQHMGELIDDMLRLSRVTRNEMTIETVDLSALAQEVGAAMAQDNPGHKVDFVVQPGLVVKGDRALLHIVLVNLLGNAWKFTFHTAHARITFGSVTDPDHGLSFYVRDNGAGFDPRYAAKLFVAFQRLHAQEQFPGTGIGLATVHRAIRRHGGETWAVGEPDKGATFYFTVPTVLESKEENA
jgi:hypothetical protein